MWRTLVSTDSSKNMIHSFKSVWFSYFIGILFHSVVLVLAVQQTESAVCIHMSPLFWISFLFRSPQSIEQNSLCCTVGPHSVQFSSVAQSCPTLRPHGLGPARQASLSITNSQNFFRLMSIESVMPSNHLTLCRPLLLPPSVFSSIRVFSNESVHYLYRIHSVWASQVAQW